MPQIVKMWEKNAPLINSSFFNALSNICFSWHICIWLGSLWVYCLLVLQLHNLYSLSMLPYIKLLYGMLLSYIKLLSDMIHILWNYSKGVEAKLLEHFLSYVFNTTDLQIDYSFQLTDSIEV